MIHDRRAMSPRWSIVVAFALGVGLSGCLAKTVADAVTAPVRLAGKGAGKAADWATTSQSEADRNRGRALRHREERLAKLDRAYRDNRVACGRGDRTACDRARAQYEQIQASAPWHSQTRADNAKATRLTPTRGTAGR